MSCQDKLNGRKIPITFFCCGPTRTKSGPTGPEAILAGIQVQLQTAEKHLK